MIGYCSSCGRLHTLGQSTGCPIEPIQPVRFTWQTPFCCPVCAGKGLVYGVGYAANTAPDTTCPACRGTCVVWGPPA